MRPPPSSSRIPPAIRGYEYDPVSNRFFKSPSSGPSRPPVKRTATNVASNGTSDGPPIANLRPPSVRRPTRPEFDPETDCGSASKRSRHATSISYVGACSASTHPALLASPLRRGGLAGRIAATTVSNFDGEQPTNLLILGSSCSEAIIGDFGKLFHRQPSLGWLQVDLSPCITPGTIEPLTAIASKAGVTCFAATSGCVITTPMSSDYIGLPHLVQRASFTNTTWSLCLTAQHLLMGCEKSLAVYDYQRQTTVSQNPKSSVFAIERQDEFNFLLGTRSGGIIQFDIRSPHIFHRNELLRGRSICHLKHVDDHQFLIGGTMGYAKLHDIRYLTSNPTMSLDGWDNGCDRSFGLAISKDRNLVCMPGRDQTIKVWDLKSQPVSGFGLQPVARHATNHPASSVMFVDKFQPEFWALERKQSTNQKRPCGPGILYAEDKSFYWLGPQTV
ncbi:hypothetical protein PGT21_031916 [Puccinia graminis f. sp. tritici]|uniref:Uncharacterized protein n=1 Tax=Puccinia graminis f. sp. tritici TaxID=56615 RepID=A0A5B0NE12_PUCGR|nr:hypothetical protein PGT21_031916 [Puccinia graminis f. sp. tritici]